MSVTPCKDSVPENNPNISKSKTLNKDYLPDFALYGKNDSAEAKSAQGTGWELSPTPFYLSPEQYDRLIKLGPILLQFLEALDTLYKHSVAQTPVKGWTVPTWVADYFHIGKPEALIQFSQMKRFRSQLPMVIRPDLLITANGFSLTEIDSVPGGLGFLAALNEAYRKSGFTVIEGHETLAKELPGAFIQALKAQSPGIDVPTVGIIVSDEASDYLPEWRWLLQRLQVEYPQIHLLHPRQVDLSKDKLIATLEDGQEIQLDLIYRFFELFDLPNIPKIDLIQYALKKKLATGTPPFKSHLEEKMMMAFVHHPSIQGFWEGQLGKDIHAELKALMPATWIVDARPLPPHAVIAGLEPDGHSVQSFEQLGHLSQKGRQLVLKPSGFSPLAWGSRGVAIGHDMSSEDWQERLKEALSSFLDTPYVLQTFHNPATQTLEKLTDEGQTVPFQAKTRLCPYYFVVPDANGKLQTYLSGILATACPADKKIIHGMRDAVLAPCAVQDS